VGELVEGEYAFVRAGSNDRLGVDPGEPKGVAMNARFTILALALLVAGQADTLRLRNGATVTGSWLGGTTDEVRFMVDDQVRRYPRSDIVEVDFTSIGAVNPVAPVAPTVAIQPDVVGVPFMRSASGLMPLEREIGMLVRSNTMYGMGPSVYRIQGAQSPVRVRRSDKIVFVLRLNSSGDPRRYELYPLDSRMNYRQTQPTRGGGRPLALPATIAKIGDSIYEISPARPLYPGEYSVSPIDSSESYCFGVDY
jgi:hypothetical protein